MSDSKQSASQPTEAASAFSGTVEQRAQAVVESVIARRRAGEVVDDQQVLRDHPELLGPLERLLHKASIVSRVRASASPSGPPPMERLLDGLADPGRAARESSAAPTPKSDQINHHDKADGDGPRLTLERCSRLQDWEASDEPAVDGAAVAYRPSSRPPTAILRMLDDGQRSGEVFRLRASTTVIGRKSGDIRVPHDSWMSVKHARIARREGPNGWRWTLRDLKSTNGVYVRVVAARLRNGDQMLIGNRTVRFVLGKKPSDPCRLDELHGEQTGQQLCLTDPCVEIGRDQSVCADFLTDEPTVDQRGVSFHFDEAIGWSVEAAPTTNGLWARVAKVDLIDGAMFQLGEQRFAFSCR